MPTINQLPTLDTLEPSNQVPTYSVENGDARKFSLSTLTAYLEQTMDLPDNADEITYDPAGTGAVSRTVQAKLRETLSVLDFGAVGDGVTDDTAAIQAAINAASFGGIVLFPGNKQYLTTAPIVLKGAVTLQGEGTDNTKPEYGHFSQIYSYHNGATFVFNGATVPKAYQYSNIQFVNLKMMSNKATYPQSTGIVATKTYGGCVVENCHIRAYSKCLSLTTTYGFVINNTSLITADYGVFVDCTAPAIPVPDGLYQTNVLQITNSIVQTQTGTGIYFNGPGNVLNIVGSVIENNNIGILLKKYSGAAPAGALDINDQLQSVNIQNCYFEKNYNGHIFLGANTGIEPVNNVNVTGNNINKDDTTGQCIHIQDVRNGVFNNEFRNGAGINPYRLLSYSRGVELRLSDGQVYDGNFSVSTTNRCSISFANPANRITEVYVEPGNPSALTGDLVTKYYAGNSTQPVASLNDAINLINFFSDNYRAKDARSATLYVKNSGSAGALSTLPICLQKLNIYRDPASTTTPEIAGANIDGALSVSITGPMNLLKHTSGASFLPNYMASDGAALSIDNCSFNFVSPAAGAQFCKAANGGTVVLTSTVTSIGDTPTFGVSANKGIVYRGGSTVAGSSGDQVIDGLVVPSPNGSATYDPPSIAAAGQATTTVTVTGAALGDTVTASFSNSLGGLTLSAYVSSANTVTCVFFNPTAGAIDLTSGTLRAKVVY